MQNADHPIQKAPRQRNKTLLAGWFSFERGHSTAGDLLAGDVACEWLERAGCSYDVALAPPFHGGVDWRSVDPQSYSNVVFVCGPFEKRRMELEFLGRFADCNVIGLNLSMLVPLDVWNPFDSLFERDSSVGANPDIVFLSHQTQVPVVGVVPVEPYEGGATQVANAAIHRLVNSREMSMVAIDTRLDANSTGLRSSAEIESLIARMDVVVTTRLHGTVLALKNGVPAVAIDPEVGGAKIRRQAETIGWPIVFNVDDLTDETLQEAFDYCLTDDAQAKAKECGQRAMKAVQEVGDQFISVLDSPRESQRTEPVHGRRWLRDQWLETKSQSCEEHGFLQLWGPESTVVKESQETLVKESQETLVKESQDALVKESQKVQRLRRRARRLERRIRNLEQQVRIMRNSKVWKLSKRLGRIRAKLPGR
jgi:hypothetical protein